MMKKMKLRRLRPKSKYRRIWLCDPRKNKRCKKTFCYYKFKDGLCRHTHQIECALNPRKFEMWKVD